MPRTARIDYPGARHHVMNRGARRQPIFLDEVSCGCFIDLLRQLPRRFGVEVHGFALMPNHYHLLLRAQRGRLGDAVRYLDGDFARFLNQRFHWDGPVFKGRYRNRVVEKDVYWRTLLSYVHLNPVRARLVHEPGDAGWTSHEYYAGTHSPPDWMRCDELLSLFGGHAGYRAHMRALQLKRSALPEDFEQTLWRAPHTALAAPMRPVPAVDLAPRLEQVLTVTGARPGDLRTPRRGRRGNRERLVAAWWLFNEGKVSQAEVAQALAMTTGAVAKAIHDVNRRRPQDAELADWIRNLIALRELQ
ncbi:MAG: transposase [Pseudomonadota bacterium]